MFFVYILKNKNNQTYIGYTQNLSDRLHRHNSNRERSTKNKGPFEIIYNEVYNSRSAAMKREKELKSGQGRLWIKMKILKNK